MHDRKGLGWWQSGIITGGGAPASILVEVDRDGTYEFRLRRWPEAVDQPISSAAKVRVPSNAYGGTKMVQSTAGGQSHAQSGRFRQNNRGDRQHGGGD
ncbi:MAG: hypothetical protein OSB41_08750, partial [Kiritimatiellae bacterium]|nr:hypothetical protein [Kiritimatiellia bacterium]